MYFYKLKPPFMVTSTYLFSLCITYTYVPIVIMHSDAMHNYQFWVNFGSPGLNLKGHQVIWVNKCDLVATVVHKSSDYINYCAYICTYVNNEDCILHLCTQGT